MLGRRGLLIAAAVLALSGCVATNKFAGTRTVYPGATLSNARMQIYSFLDIREAAFGPKMLGEFDKQLAAALGAASVSVQNLRFNDSEARRYFSGVANTGVMVPIRQTVIDHRGQEQLFGATHRLIIFPSEMTIAGATAVYDIRWDIYDVKTGRLIWTTTSHGVRTNNWTYDEDPQGRAKLIVDGFMAELRNSQLL